MRTFEQLSGNDDLILSVRREEILGQLKAPP